MQNSLTLAAPELEQVNTMLTKANSCESPVSASAIRQTLLKIVEDDAAPAAPEASCSRGTTKVWWPNVKKMLNNFKGPGLAAERDFEIQSDELKVQEEIGEGLRSKVFAADLKAVKGRVVVKKLRAGFDSESDEKRTRLMQDLETLAATLRHPFIVEFVGVNLSKEERSVNLVFEMMGGGTLEDYMDSKSGDGQVHRVSFGQTLRWSIQLFQALKFLHDRNPPIIHRDVKPCNLMLSADLKTLKLRDFGISKTVELGIRVFGKRATQECAELKTDLSKLTGPSNRGFTGTARYMAPEIGKSKDYTPAVDVYSGALVMWFLLEGERPWERHHGHVACEVAKKGRRPPLREDGVLYPQKMALLISQCWAADPAARPHAAAVEAQLLSFQTDARRR